MIVDTVFAFGAWRARHVPSLDCWCRPRQGEDGDCMLVIHRHLDVGCADRRYQRAFVTGKIEAPV